MKYKKPWLSILTYLVWSFSSLYIGYKVGLNHRKINECVHILPNHEMLEFQHNLGPVATISPVSPPEIVNTLVSSDKNDTISLNYDVGLQNCVMQQIWNQAGVSCDNQLVKPKDSHTLEFSAGYINIRKQALDGVPFPAGYASGATLIPKSQPNCNNQYFHIISSATRGCHLLALTHNDHKPSTALLPWSPLTYRVKASKGRRPTSKASVKASLEELGRFLSMFDDVELQLRRKISNGLNVQMGDDVVVMCLNEGMMDLLMNFICSARNHGIDIGKNLLVFVTSEEMERIVDSAGVTAFYHKAFGEFPKTAAAAYGDNIFARMMLLKTSSVYSVMRLGYSVLFQDADLVWFKDPLPHFHSTEKTTFDEFSGLEEMDLAVIKKSLLFNNYPSNAYDSLFMDDGARSSRFSPFYSNSGFYYLRNNVRTMHFIKKFLYYGDKVNVIKSHQEVLTELLSEEKASFGLSVGILTDVFFPQGKMYHHRKDYISLVMSGAIEPYVFHMCWTLNKVEKLRYFRHIGMWYLVDTCNEAYINSYNPQSHDILSSCCRKVEDPSVFRVGKRFDLYKE